MKMGGTGSAQEDQILTIQLEQATGVKFTYVPFKGGGEVCVNLVGKHVDSTVNNPIECVSHWKAGRVRPLAVFDTARIAGPGMEGHPDGQGGPRRRHQLPDAARHLRAAGHAQGGASSGTRRLLKKVYETPEFKEYMERGRAQARLGDRARVSSSGSRRPSSSTSDLMAKGGLLKK